MDNPVKPPDMLGAGGAAPQMPAGDAVGLLRSYGTPSADLGPLLQQPTANPYAAAVSAGMPFVGRPDVVAQQQHAARLQQGQQFRQVMQVRQEQERRADKAYRQQQDYLAIGQEFLKSDNEAARGFGASVVGKALKGMGMQVPQSTLDSMVKKAVSAKDYDDIVTRFASGYTPEQVHALYPNVPPQTLQEAAGLARNPNPNLVKSLGLSDPEERQKKALDLREKQLKAWATERGIDLSSDVYSEMVKSAKKPIDTMTDPEIQALKAQSERVVADRKLSDEMRKINETEALRHKNRMAEIAERENLRAANKPLLTPALRSKAIGLQAEYVGFGARDQRLQRVKNAVALLDKKGLLPTGPTMIDFGLAAAKGGSAVNDPEVAAAWDTLQRYGVPMIANAEKELAGQPIGNMLRLKSIAEAEVGGIRRVPAIWWKDFFQDYDAGVKGRKDLIEQQLEALGADVPQAPKPAPPGPLADPKAEYKKLRDAGRSHEQAIEDMKGRGYDIR